MSKYCLTTNLRVVPWCPEMSLPLKLSSTLCSTWWTCWTHPGAEQVDYRVDKGGRELLQLGHPPTVRDDPGRPIRDYGRPARHVSWWQQLGSVSKHHEVQTASKVVLMINSCSWLESDRSQVLSTVERCPRSQSEEQTIYIDTHDLYQRRLQKIVRYQFQYKIWRE